MQDNLFLLCETGTSCETGMTEGKRCTGKKLDNILDGLIMWIGA